MKLVNIKVYPTERLMRTGAEQQLAVIANYSDGTVRDMKYHRGRFMAASEDRASEENERNAMVAPSVAFYSAVILAVSTMR